MHAPVGAAIRLDWKAVPTSGAAEIVAIDEMLIRLASTQQIPLGFIGRRLEDPAPAAEVVSNASSAKVGRTLACRHGGRSRYHLARSLTGKPDDASRG